MAQLKAPTSYEDQLNILKARNVVVDDPARCTGILEKVNYYRLSAYFLPFKLPNGTYRPGTNFYTVYRIYEFDRRLRGILFSALEEVEIYLRTKFSYFHAHKYGAEGYMNPAAFSAKHKAEKFQENLAREIRNNSNSSFVKHHNQHYSGHFPIWVAVELFTFGMLSRFYSDLTTSDQKDLAKKLYGSIPKNLISWLRCCTDLRNICAHYGRLYFRVFPAVPANIGVFNRQASQLWGAVLALRALYPDAKKWNNTTLLQLYALFDEYQQDISIGHIGFPKDWKIQLKMS